MSRSFSPSPHPWRQKNLNLFIDSSDEKAVKFRKANKYKQLGTIKLNVYMYDCTLQ